MRFSLHWPFSLVFFSALFPNTFAYSATDCSFPQRPLQLEGVHTYLPSKKQLPPIFAAQLNRLFAAEKKRTKTTFSCLLIDGLPPQLTIDQYAQAVASHWHTADHRVPTDQGILIVIDTSTATGTLLRGGQLVAQLPLALQRYLNQKYLTQFMSTASTNVQHERLYHAVKSTVQCVVDALTGKRTAQEIMQQRWGHKERAAWLLSLIGTLLILLLTLALWRTRHRKMQDPDITEVERWLEYEKNNKT